MLTRPLVAAMTALATLAVASAPVVPRPAAAQDTTALTYAVPDGWTRRDGPGSGVSLLPDGLPAGRVFVVTVLPSEAFAGPPAAYHADALRRIMGAGARALAPPHDGTLGSFLATTVYVVAPNGIRLWMGIYSARWGGRGQVLVASANTDALVRTYAPVAEAMIRRIQLPSAAAASTAVASTAAASAPSGAPAASTSGAGAVDMSPAPAAPCYRPTGVEICPKPVLAGGRVVPIVGAYLATAARTSFSVDPRDPGVRSRVGTTILLLFANGVAARANAMKSGAIDDTYWAEGFATMDARDPSSLGERRAGRWSERDGTITIVWQNGPPSTLTRAGEGLMERATRWTSYPSIDGLRLDGRYERVVPFGPPWSITLHRNGTFTSDGLNNTMGGTAINPGFPEHGAGTYEITRWSLVLRFGNGFVQSINLLLGPGGPQNPANIVLNGYDYTRR